jgi:cellulose synthase/poly-beta-1,6-N-acetylglucosamine synthase-like glycosyltransferase
MFEAITVIDYLFLGALGSMLLVQMYYFFVVLGKFAFYKPQPSQKRQQEPVSIVIAARNEFDNLLKYLPAILNQDYPEFEVVVVNHCSFDMSQGLLEELQTQYKHLKVSQLLEQEKYPTGKKFALTIGIKAAKYDQILFTDADCNPASNQWLALMQSRFINNKEIVLGFSPFYKKKGLLNLFDRFETFITAVFYFSYALAGNAFMGVGRNMAYRKELFFKHKGFASHQHIMSGDDDLFVNEAATKYNVTIECSADSFVYTEAKDTYEKWSRQKTRHMTTGKLYKGKHKQSLGVFYASLFLFYGLLATSLIVNIFTWPIVLGLYLLRLISEVVVYYQSAVKLKSTNMLWALPLLDIMYVSYLLVFGFKGLFTKNPKVW